MDTLPQELVEAILEACVNCDSKNNMLSHRLVCRAFNYGLRPYVLRTLNLDFTRLNRALGEIRPTADALQTVGYQCKGLFIDLMVLRDGQEADFLCGVFSELDSMKRFCEALQEKYRLGEQTFTEMEYYHKVEELLFNCRGVERLRLSLPFQLIGRQSDTATMMLANTFKAFAMRPAEDSAPIKILVLENVTDIAMCHLWVNPMDLRNIMKVVEPVEHLVLGLRRHESNPENITIFGSCLWNLIEYAGSLKSLCIVALDTDDCPPRTMKQTTHWRCSPDEWRACALPFPRINIESLTCLELKRIEVCPRAFIRATEDLGDTLEELYLNEVYLKTEQSPTWNGDLTKVLWTGEPNVRPPSDGHWMAMPLRGTLTKLRICRASFLAYDLFLHPDTPAPNETNWDRIDPCGQDRSLSQRFVEIVLGIQQPNMPDGTPVEYLHPDPKKDHLFQSLQERQDSTALTEYDAIAYQSAVCNPTSRWLRSIDGYFPNLNSRTLDELHYIADTACRGMSDVQRVHYR